MSAGHREYHVNVPAANELERQATRARQILERLAAHLAATEPCRGQNLRDLVEREHVRRAAELLFGSVTPAGSRGDPGGVFLSFCHEDDAFVNELAERLSRAGVSCFKADRDVQPAADWAEAIWEAINRCRVFVPIVTPRFIKSRWLDLEGGAACASHKHVLTVLRYVDRGDLPVPFDRFQAMVVENGQQFDRLIQKLKEICSG